MNMTGLQMDVRSRLIDRDTGDTVGIVFWDDEWDAYGWRTDDFTNGPYDSEEEALAALRGEFASDRAFRLMKD
jgi:hypothetical protein